MLVLVLGFSAGLLTHLRQESTLLEGSWMGARGLRPLPRRDEVAEYPHHLAPLPPREDPPSQRSYLFAVREVLGGAEYRPDAGRGDWLPLEAGTLLQSWAELRTRGDGRVRMEEFAWGRIRRRAARHQLHLGSRASLLLGRSLCPGTFAAVTLIEGELQVEIGSGARELLLLSGPNSFLPLSSGSLLLEARGRRLVATVTGARVRVGGAGGIREVGPEGKWVKDPPGAREGTVLSGGDRSVR